MLEKEFPNRIEYEPIKDMDVTGNFEITLMQTRHLIHSKKNGQGTCESDKERDRLKSILKVFFKYQSAKKPKKAISRNAER